MKIGILVYRMSGYGGIERITAQKINAWIELFGYNVILITKNQQGFPMIYELNKECKFYDLGIPSRYGGGIKPYVKNISIEFKFITELKRILEIEKIDVLFSTMIGLDSLLIPFLSKKIPKIHEIHQSGCFLDKKKWFFKKIFVKKYHKVALLNNNELNYFNMSNTVIIPNFLDNCNIGVVDSLKKEKIIISAGRFDSVKQFDHLVDIWSIISLKYKDWQLHIYGNGSGNIRKNISDKIIKNRLDKSFKIFPGTFEIKSKMNEAKIFVLVSKSEAFPMVLLEAMSAKLPIISYDSPNGPRNIVTDGVDGFIVPLNDKLAFAEKLDLLINNPKIQEDFVQNQKSKLDLFSKQRVMNQWNDLILDLLDKKSKKSFFKK